MAHKNMQAPTTYDYIFLLAPVAYIYTPLCAYAYYNIMCLFSMLRPAAAGKTILLTELENTKWKWMICYFFISMLHGLTTQAHFNKHNRRITSYGLVSHDYKRASVQAIRPRWIGTVRDGMPRRTLASSICNHEHGGPWINRHQAIVQVYT